jgi:hypothetical protein
MSVNCEKKGTVKTLAFLETGGICFLGSVFDSSFFTVWGEASVAVILGPALLSGN